jgi:hypothetical protein
LLLDRLPLDRLPLDRAGPRWTALDRLRNKSLPSKRRRAFVVGLREMMQTPAQAQNLTPQSLPAGKLATYNRQLFVAIDGLARQANHLGMQQT